MGATGEEPVQPPIRVWSGVPFRVDAFYMKANNDHKVSNLTVTPHRNIPLPNSPTKGAPLLASFALHYRGYLTDINELAAGGPKWPPMAFNI